MDGWMDGRYDHEKRPLLTNSSSDLPPTTTPELQQFWSPLSTLLFHSIPLYYYLPA